MTSFIALALSMLAAATFFEIDLLYFVLYVCVGIYFWCRWHTPRALTRVSAERTFNSHAFLGESLPVRVNIKNRSVFGLPWLRVADGLPWELRDNETLNEIVALPRRHGLDLSYSIKARRRGYYRIGPLILETGDLFGLFPEKRHTAGIDHITVYPRLRHIAELGLPSRLPFGTITSHQRLFSDPSRPAGVRDYRSSDSLRHINWKTSSHVGALKVRNFQPAISMESAVLLNLNRSEFTTTSWLDGSEWSIEVAASLIAHLAGRKQAVGLVTNGVDPLRSTKSAHFDEKSRRLALAPSEVGKAPPPFPPKTGRVQLMKLLEVLARIEAGSSSPFHLWAPGACLHLGWGVSVFAITPTADERACSAMHGLVRAGFNPILLITEPVYFSPVRERAHRLGFSAYRIGTQSDLDAWNQTGTRVS